MFTQTLPFPDWLTLALSAKATLLLGASPSDLLTVNQGPADLLISTAIPSLTTLPL
jgi:hypothetical protein